MLLGPSVLGFFQLPWFTDIHLEESIHHLAEIGVIFLMFLAGMEIELKEMARTGRAAALAGLLGVAFPLLLGMGAGLLFGLRAQPALFLGIVLSATSVSISAQTLMELGVLRRRESLTLLGAAVFDDVVVIVVLSLFLALQGGGSGGWPARWRVVVRMLLYLVAGHAAGLLAHPHAAALRRAAAHHPRPGLFRHRAGAAVCLVGGGAGRGGRHHRRVCGRPGRGPLTAAAGDRAQPVGSYLWFLCAAVLRQHRPGGQCPRAGRPGAGLRAGAGGGGGGQQDHRQRAGRWWGGLPQPEALRLGVGMVSRGEVGLIVASVGLSQGLIDQVTFAQIVLVVLATTLITPLLLRQVYARASRPPAANPPAPAASNGG